MGKNRFENFIAFPNKVIILQPNSQKAGVVFFLLQKLSDDSIFVVFFNLHKCFRFHRDLQPASL